MLKLNGQIARHRTLQPSDRVLAHGDDADGAVNRLLGPLENESDGAMVGRRNVAAYHKEELSC